MNLEKSLAEHWPPHRVIATCKECDAEFFDTKKERPAMWQPSYLATLIETFARKHEERTGHASIDVGIDLEPTVVREIDCEITVNG